MDYFHQLGEHCQIILNDAPVDNDVLKQCDGIVFSPGPGVPENAGNLLKWIEASENKLSMLGICLGHQAICQYYGGKVNHAIRPMHGKISKVHRLEDKLFDQIPEYFNVVRYHSLICNPLPNSLKILALTDENEPMAFKHYKLPIWGLQFHPEAALTEYGLEILYNWIKLIKGPN